MRRRLVTLATALFVALAMAVPVGAATLHQDHQGTECGGFVELHFVNNQTRGDSDVVLFVEFDTGTVAVGEPHKSNGGTNHWTITALESQTLVTAYTEDGSGVDGVGKLVLSDYKCKAQPPPKK